jgi:hypothetical protein
VAADDRGFKIASAYVEVSLDEDQVDAGIADLNSKLAGIRDAAIRIGLDPAQIDAAIADIQAKLETLRGQAGVGISQADLDATIADIQAKLTALGAEKVNIRIGTTGAAQATGEMAGLAAVMKAIEDNSGPLVAAISGLAVAEKSVGDESETTASKVSGAGQAVAAAGEQAHSAGGWFGMLSKEVTLFGGALGDMHMVGAIPLWHILMDGILETSITLIEATVALTAFGLAAAPAAEDVYNHIKSVDDVVKTLGIDIPPVTGHMHDLGRAIAPQVLELFGGAMNLVSSNGSSLADVIGRIVTGFDDWMAKLDIFEGKQAHDSGLVKSGADVLQQMSVILDNLGGALTNLVKADPGTVHFLGDLLEAGSKLIEIFTEIPTPILYTALAIHSFMLWGGLLTSGIVKILSPLGGLIGLFGKLPGVSDEASAAITKVADGVKTMGGVFPAATKATEELGTEAEKTAESTSKLPPVLQALSSAGIWGWAAVGAAAIGGLVYWMTTADSATKGFIANLNNGLSQLDPGQAILQINTDIAQLDQQVTMVGPRIQTLNEQANQMSTTFGKSVEASITGVPEMLSSWGAFGKEFGNIGDSVVNGVKLIGSEFGLLHGWLAEGSDIAAYKGAIVSLTSEQDHLFAETGKLIGQGFTYNQSLALMGLAGVQSSDSLAVMDQKVENLIKGYQDMSVQGGILANSVNAVTFSTEQQNSKVTALTQGWTTFIGLVTGGMSGFSTFETQVAGLGQVTSDTATIAVSAGKATIKSAAATSSSASSYSTQAMSASSANSAITTYTSNLVKGSTAQQQAANYQQKLTASLQAGGDTASQAKNAVDAYTSSVTQNGVGSNAQAGARSKLLNDLDKTTTVASKATTATTKVTSSLDGVSAASLQLQQTWVGAITDGSSLMNNLLEMASAAGLGAQGTQLLGQAGKDMVSQLLPMAKGSADATAQLYALAQQAGYQGPDSFQALTTWVGKTKDAEQNLQEITSRLTVASADLASDVENLANALNQNLNQAMSAAVFQASGGQKAFDQFATAVAAAERNGSTSLGDLSSSAGKLATELISVMGNTTQAHNEFDSFAIQMHLTKQQADALWDSVVRLAKAEADIPPVVKSVIQITEQITQGGSGGITGIQNSALPKAAHGMLVQGGIKGRDSVLVATKPGELIVPTEMVDAGAVDHLRGRIPGFAKGGVVPSSAPAVRGVGDFAVAAPVVQVTQQFFGPQHPTPEMQHAMILNLTAAIGSAG